MHKTYDNKLRRYNSKWRERTCASLARTESQFSPSSIYTFLTSVVAITRNVRNATFLTRERIEAERPVAD